MEKAITIMFYVSPSAAVEAGVDKAGYRRVIATPSALNTPQRTALNLLLSASRQIHDGVLVGGIQMPPVPTTIDEESLPAYLDQVSLRVEAARIKRAADEAERHAQRRADIEAWLAAPEGQHIYSCLDKGHLVWRVGEPRAPYGGTNSIPDDLAPAYQARLKSETALASQAQHAAAERTAREMAEREAGEFALRTWALSYGSERLRLMLDLKVGEWQAIAEQEYVGFHAPAGYTRETYAAYEESEPRKRPTTAELLALRDARAECDDSCGVLDGAALMYCAESQDDDDDLHYTCVEIDVYSPDGASYVVARRIVS